MAANGRYLYGKNASLFEEVVQQIAAAGGLRTEITSGTEAPTTLMPDSPLQALRKATEQTAEDLARKGKLTLKEEQMEGKSGVDYADIRKKNAEKALADYDRRMGFDDRTAQAFKKYDDQRNRLQMEANRENDKYVQQRDTADIEAMSEEERQALEQYAVNRVRDQNLPLEMQGMMPTARQEAAGLIGKYAKRADELAETFMRQENAELAQQAEAAGRKFAEEKPVLASAATIPVNLMAAITGTVGQLQGAARSTGRYSTMDANETGTALDVFSSSVREQTAQNIEGEDPNMLRKGASWLYQGGMSFADSMARMLVSGGSSGIASAIAASGAFSQGLQKYSAMGASPEQAATAATASAGLEYITEKLPTDKVLKIFQKGGNQNAVKEVLKQAFFVEPTGEEVNLFAGMAAEALILGENSSKQQRIGDLIAGGMTKAEAEKQFWKETFQEAVNTYAVSGFAGLFGGGAAAYAGSQVQTRQDQQPTVAPSAPEATPAPPVSPPVETVQQEVKPEAAAPAPEAPAPAPVTKPQDPLQMAIESVTSPETQQELPQNTPVEQETQPEVAPDPEYYDEFEDFNAGGATEPVASASNVQASASKTEATTGSPPTADSKSMPTEGGQPQIKGTGAAEANFSGKAAYQDLLTDENTQRDRPGDVRPIEVPKTDGYGRKVSEFVGNAYGAEVTPDRMANEIETLVQEGALGYGQRSNKQSLEIARDYIYGKEGSKGKGEAATRNEISRNIANGKIQDGDIEKAMILYAKAANRKSDSSLDHASELFVDLATMARMSGRNLQLFKLLRKMTPEGQLMAVQKNIDRCIEDINRSRTKKNKVGNNQSAETEKVVSGAISSAKEDTTEIIKEAGRKVRYGNGKVTVEGNQAGEPFVFEYAQKVGEALAKGLENSQKPKQRKEKTFMQTITDELRKFAAEKMPQQKRNRKTLTATELLRDYVQNQEFYAEAWGAAQEALRKDHGDDPAFQEFMNSGIGVDANANPRNKIMAKALAATALETGETTEMLRKQQALGITGMSDTIANKLIQETGATGEMAQTIRDAAKEFVNGRIREADNKENARTYEPGRFVDEAMRDIKKTMSEVAKQNTRGREATKQSIIGTLTQKYGFGEADASHIAEVVGSSFDQKTQEQARKLLEQKLGEKEKRKPRSAGEMIEEYANLGAYAPDSKYSDKATESFIRAAMQDIGKTISDLAKSGKADRAVVKAQLSQMITQRHGIDKADADHIAEVVGEQLTQMVEGQAKKILEQRFADRKKSEKKTAAQLMKEYSNLGAFDIGSEYNVQASSKVLGGNYGIGIDEELAEAYKNATTDEARQTILDAIYVEAAGRIPSTMEDKWNAWRYMAMLGNAKTQVRNFAGNAAFMPYKAAKDKMAAIFERAIPKEQRTKALTTDRELLNWAKADAKTDAVRDAMKYSARLGDDLNRAKLRENMKVFDTKALERVRKFVEKVPQAGDMLFKNGYYEHSLAGFLKARGYKAADIQNGNVSEDVLSEARSYAIQEAMKATFNDSNAFSDFMATGLRYKGDNPIGKALNIAAEGVLPFRRTPANIVVRFTEYSPVGLAKGAWDTATKVRNGDLSAAAAIDQISAGLTGTAVMALGFFLANGICGVKITGSGTDEDEKRQGHQDYALEFSIDGQEYSYKIDWAAPANLPLFVGANINRMMEEAGAETDVSKFTSILHGMGTMFEPMLALSCMSSLNDLVEGVRYADEGEALYSMAASMATSYFTQGVPALARQYYQSKQEYKQTTFTTSDDSTIQDLQKTVAGLGVSDAYKTDKVDAWGQKESQGTPLERGINAFLNPGTLKKIDNSAVEKEITRLNEAQEDSVSPPTAAKTVSYTDKDGNVHKDIRLTEEQYQTFATTLGQTAKEILTTMISSPDYKDLTDSQKADAIRKVYSYAQEEAKKQALPDYNSDAAAWMNEVRKDPSGGILNRAVLDSITDAVADASSRIRNGWDVTSTSKQNLNESFDTFQDLSKDTQKQILEQATGDTARYLQARQGGISTDQYLTTTQRIGALGDAKQPQKLETIAKQPGLTEDQRVLMAKLYASDAQDKNIDEVKAMGYNYATYTRLYNDHENYTKGTGKKKRTIAHWQEVYGFDYKTAKALYEVFS